MPELFFVKPTENPEDIRCLMAILDDVEYEKSQRFMRREDQYSYIVAHALKRLVLASELNRHVSDLMFSSSPFGKPFLLNEPLYFNLSHTTGMIAFVCSRYGEVGVDVEHCMRTTWHQSVARMTLSDMEYKCMEKKPDREKYFLKLWTMKESVAKADGRGVSLNFRQIIADDAGIVVDATRWCVQYYYPSKEHVATLAFLHGDEEEICCNILNMNTLSNLAQASQAGF